MRDSLKHDLTTEDTKSTEKNNTLFHFHIFVPVFFVSSALAPASLYRLHPYSRPWFKKQHFELPQTAAVSLRNCRAAVDDDILPGRK